MNENEHFPRIKMNENWAHKHLLCVQPISLITSPLIIENRGNLNYLKWLRKREEDLFLLGCPVFIFSGELKREKEGKAVQ